MSSVFEKPNAKVVVLKQTSERLPEFYRFAARLKARDRVVTPGDLLIAYRVHSTVPDGPVLVTDSTQFVFAG